MHEMSLVQGLIGQLAEISKRQKARKIKSVTVEIGPFSGVVIDSFSFAYDVLKDEYDLLRGSRLIIDSPTPVLKCPVCGEEMDIGSGPSALEAAAGPWGLASARQCPRCKDSFMVPEGGDQILLKQVEME